MKTDLQHLIRRALFESAVFEIEALRVGARLPRNGELFAAAAKRRRDLAHALERQLAESLQSSGAGVPAPDVCATCVASGVPAAPEVRAEVTP